MVLGCGATWKSGLGVSPALLSSHLLCACIVFVRPFETKAHTLGLRVQTEMCTAR